MPEHASVAIYEDGPFCLSEIEKLLRKGGHRVVAVAGSYEEAEALTAKIVAGQARPYIVCMDGHLGRSHRDGERFAKLLKAVGVLVINTSCFEATWADYSCPKGSEALRSLSSLIDRL